MIKQISFNEIKLHWKYLWPDIDINKDIPHIYLPDCKYVSKLYRSVDVSSLEKILPNICIGYFVGEKIVGVLNGYQTSRPYFRTRGLWVYPEYRKMGVATTLMENIEDYALKVSSKILWTVPRKESIGFYQKYGFKRTTEFELYGGNNCYAIKYIGVKG